MAWGVPTAHCQARAALVFAEQALEGFDTPDLPDLMEAKALLAEPA